VLISDATGIKSIRAILPLSQNIRALVIKLPFKAIRLFPMSLVLVNLVSLNLNIPHATVAPFLQRHPHLETLQLGACGNANLQICPLTHFSLQLPLLNKLFCPPGCVRALIAGTVVNKLFTTYDGVRRLHFPMYKLLNFCPILTLATITTLLVDFDHTTPALLHRISVAAPTLQVLKLTESKFSRKVRHSAFCSDSNCIHIDKGTTVIPECRDAMG